MTGRSPARLLAPLALVVTAVALFLIVSPSGDDASDGGGGTQPSATATPASSGGKGRDKRRSSSRRTYTVRAGDTPSAIAEREDVSLEELLEANPDVDPNGLTPGQKLKLP